MKQVPWFWRKQSDQPDQAESAVHLIRFTAVFALFVIPFGFWVRAFTPAFLSTAFSQKTVPGPQTSEVAPDLKEPAAKANHPSPLATPMRSSTPSEVSKASNRSIESATTACLAPAQPFPSIDRLLTDTGTLIAANLGATVAAQFSPQPFPEVHGVARLARVPVIMYHDVLPEKQVFFDVTPAELQADFELIRQKGMTPISFDQLLLHLSTGIPLPAKPIMLTFDDGYQGHYDYVYPLLKQYNYPAVFAIYTQKVDRKMGRSSLTWAEVQEMAANPLVTIASHSLTHPADLTKVSDQQLRKELTESKRLLEEKLGIAIPYFVYPEGNHNEYVEQAVRDAGYRAALIMDHDDAVYFAGDSKDLLSIERIGYSHLKTVVDQADGGSLPPLADSTFRFGLPIQLHQLTVDRIPMILASGGQLVTIHADQRYRVEDMIAGTNAVAAIDGGFFSLESLSSNVMVGPVYSQNTGQFVATDRQTARRISGRPLALISATEVKFIPFDPQRHNTLAGIQAELPGLTDAFVAAAWLVKDGQPRSPESFGNLTGFEIPRDRAFWGIDQTGRPIVGITSDLVDSVALSKTLSRSGMRDIVMVDSGASTSLVFQGKSQMSFEPRPVPHIVALVPASGLRLTASQQSILCQDSNS